VSFHNHSGSSTLATTLVIVVTAAAGAAAKTSHHAGTPASSRQPAAQVIRVSSRGFDWGDAGIGAAAGVGLSMLAVGGGLLITANRRRGVGTGEATVSSVDAPMLGSRPLARASVSTHEREAK
jgi:hypothetical protein